ncbi:MAG: hypothetical protein IKT12_01340, partial [Thermoguttaceae bacterium]|nr:hypothetical protein [Thermoguttaceae bacterium]
MNLAPFLSVFDSVRSLSAAALRPLCAIFAAAGMIAAGAALYAENASIAPVSEEIEAGIPDGFELETRGASDPADLQASLDRLKAQIDALRRELDGKQDAPDTRKKFSARVGGMLEIESVAVDQSRTNREIYGDIDNDYGFRDVRLWVKGDGYENLAYNVTLGFTGRLTFKNVALTAKELPILGNVTVGHYDVEMGMGYLESTYDYTFVEEDSVNTTFSFGRR